MENLKLIIISGPSGVGKGTIINNLLNLKETLQLAVSATTRKKRENEIENVDYYFYSKRQFNQMIDNDAFVEYCNVHGNKYGTLLSEVKKINQNNKICMLEIDTQGAKKIKKKLPQAKMIFLKPPSLEILEDRLTKRGTDNLDVIKKRVKNAKAEIEEISHYDFVLINDNITGTVKKINDFIENNFL